MSESDVYRRQILTYKDGPRTQRVNGEDVVLAYKMMVRGVIVVFKHYRFQIVGLIIIETYSLSLELR